MAHALELRCEPIPFVRIGLVGLGHRGMKTLQRYSYMKHAAIVAIADIDDAKLHHANQYLAATRQPQARVYTGENCWQTICQDPHLDIIYICTDWQSHTPIAIEAMHCGKHVVVEVPAAQTTQQCWQLVDAVEHTRRHLFMAENCCYDNFSIAIGNMAAEQHFGTLTHLEGAYIHTLNAESTWMEEIYSNHGGNPYPTHGLGPIGWLLRLHRGDRLHSLVSMTAHQGRQNTTILKTHLGKTILLQLDVTTPRPYSRLQTICGTQGFAQKYPLPTITLADGTTHTGDAALRLAEEHFTGHAAQAWQRGKSLGVENEMNYAMDSRLIHCLRLGLPLDIDVYDAAEWSCISELSKISAQNGGMPVEIPDFTRGNWDLLKKHTMY
ncbi:MAG: Gfo/Idh/MocA family oxidoreductase [Alloprevotella sp.]|nr:Gfo/Idh/MocA family oxidoreductase [Alloprevotella sp.]